MSAVPETDVAHLLDRFALELADVQAMLLRFEEVKNTSNDDVAVDRDIQNFDLSLQVLKDLEHLARILSQRVPLDIKLKDEIPFEELLLGRTRNRFGKANDFEPSPDPSLATHSSIDLF